jgi:hypothetical protein
LELRSLPELPKLPKIAEIETHIFAGTSFLAILAIVAISDGLLILQ